MAIIQGFPGLEVTIFTNGRTAKEYADPVKTDRASWCPRMVTKYIECKDNEPFRIHLKATNEYSWGFKNHILNFGALIDGVWAKGELCRQEYTEQEDWEQDISYRVVKDPDDYTRYILQEFAFSNIIKTDHVTLEQHESDAEKIERLGTIEVRVHRAIVQGNGPTSVPTGNHPKDFTISREAVKGKAKSHGTKFIRTQPAVKPDYIRCSPLTEDDGPIAVFQFKYRSREALELVGMTPDPRQPFDWLVEISDNEKGDDKLLTSGLNRQAPLGETEQGETKIKEENNDGDVKPARPKQPILPNIRRSRPMTQTQINTLINTGVAAAWSKANKRHGGIVRTDAERAMKSTKEKVAQDHQTRPNAASQHSPQQPVADSRCNPITQLSAKPLVKQESNNSLDDSAPATKKVRFDLSSLKKPRDNNNEPPSVQETKRPHFLSSCDVALPSIESSVRAIEPVARAKVKAESKDDKPSTRHIKAEVDDEDKKPTLSALTSATEPYHRFGASKSTTKSLEKASGTKNLREGVEGLADKKSVAPNPPSISHPAKTISATNVFKSMFSVLFRPVSTSNKVHTSKTANAVHPLSNSLSRPGFTPAHQIGRRPNGRDESGPEPKPKSEPESTSKTIMKSRTPNTRVSIVATSSTNKSKLEMKEEEEEEEEEKKTVALPKSTKKRKSSELVFLLPNCPIRPSKKPKRRD